MEDENTKIRQAFQREFEGAQDARSKLHENFSEQGFRLIEFRKKLIDTVITISGGFIAAPVIFDKQFLINFDLYKIGLGLLISTIVFSLLYLREHVDVDEAGSVVIRTKLLSILNSRIEKLKEYLSKETVGRPDALGYQQHRQREDYSDEMNQMTDKNKKELAAIPTKAMDYQTCLMMFLFTSGVSFVLMAILSPNIQISLIILIEILLTIITATNFAMKLTGIYARAVSLFKQG